MSRDPNAIAPQISQAAAEWFLIMREPAVSEDERTMFTAWLRASPVHVRAYLDIGRMWGDAARLGPELAVEPERVSTMVPANVLSLHAARAPWREDTAAAAAMPACAAAPPPRIPRRRFVGIAASALLLAGLAGGLAWWQLRQPTAYATGLGEQRVITLEDGSIIRLNSRSEVGVRMLPEQRLIELVEGQALFEVAKDPRRPFIVHSGDVTARAVGTQFDVYRKQGGTVVTVVEGQVEVLAVRRTPMSDAQGARPLPVPVAVAAGEQVIVSHAGVIEQRRDANVNAATRWLQQELVFEGQPLRAVVDEFNRYQRIPIVLADPELGDLRVNAVFNTTGPESLLRFVGRLDGVAVERGPQEIRITRRR